MGGREAGRELPTRDRPVGIFIVFAQAIVERSALLVRERQLGASLGVLDDAVPELLHERQPRLDVQRAKLGDVRGSHGFKLAPWLTSRRGVDPDLGLISAGEIRGRPGQ